MQEDFSKIVHERLKQARKGRHVTLRALAENVGYKASTINGVENGKTYPSERLLDAIIDELGINRQWLQTGKGSMFSTDEGTPEQRRSSRNRSLAFERISATFAKAGRTVVIGDPNVGGRQAISFANATEDEWRILTAQILTAHQVIGGLRPGPSAPTSVTSPGPVYITPDKIVHMPRELELRAVLGGIAAGMPQEAIEQAEEWVALPKAMAKEVSYALKVQGDSMVDEGIHHGDVVMINANAEPRNGSIVVAVVDGETTLKKYVGPKAGKAAYLRSANKAFPPRIVPSEELIIKGVMVGKLETDQ